jgi:hypothetical protein
MLLKGMLGEKYAQEWWLTPNKAFDGEIPKIVFESEPNKVYQYLISCAEGEW